MVDYYTLIATKFVTLGLLNFLLLVVVMAVLYAILRERKLLGGNPYIDAIVAFSISFFVFVYPALSGISIVKPITTFITQGFVFFLVFFLGIFIASLFYPNLLKFLEESMKSRNVLFGMIALALAIFITSGLISVLYSGGVGVGGPSDIQLLVAGLIIAVVILLLASHMSLKGG